jgi:hypothetical protein
MSGPFDFNESEASTIRARPKRQRVLPTAIEIDELRDQPLQDPNKRAGINVDEGDIDGRQVVSEYIKRRMILEQHPVYHLLELVAGGLGIETSQLFVQEESGEETRLVSSSSGIQSVNPKTFSSTETGAAAAPRDNPRFDGFSDPHTQLLYLINSSDFNAAKLEAVKLLFDRNLPVARSYIERPENSGVLFFGPVFIEASSSAIAAITDQHELVTRDTCPEGEYTLARFATTKKQRVLQKFAELIWRTARTNKLESFRIDTTKQQQTLAMRRYRETLLFFRRVRFSVREDDYILALPAAESTQRVSIEDLLATR